MTAAVRVTRDERDLLVVARAAFGREPFAFVEAVLAEARPLRAPGPTAMGVLERTLARAAVLELARSGGAVSRARVAGEGVARGRAWEVAPPPELLFSGYAFALLRWLVVAPLGDKTRTVPAFAETPRGLGDELVARGVVSLVRGTSLERLVASQRGVRASVLAWLSHAPSLAAAEGEEASRDGPRPAWGALFAPPLSVAVPCLEDALVAEWVARTREGPRGATAVECARVGEREVEVLRGLVLAAREARRVDLLTFLVRAAARLLPREASPEGVALSLAARLPEQGPLRDRAAARRVIAPLLRVVAELAHDHDALAAVRFFEEGHAVAQATLAAWEPLGKDGFARASRALTALDGLDPTARPEEGV